MKSPELPARSKAVTKPLIVLGIIGLLLFIVFQILPSLQNDKEGIRRTLEPSEMRGRAAAFAASELGHVPSAADDWQVGYRTDSLFYGYMSSQELLKSYEDRDLDRLHPYDVYRAVLQPENGKDRLLTVDLNMYTGEVVGFSRIPVQMRGPRTEPGPSSAGDSNPALTGEQDSGTASTDGQDGGYTASTDGQDGSTASTDGQDGGYTVSTDEGGSSNTVPPSDNGGLTLAEKQKLAEPWVRKWAAEPGRLEPVAAEGDYDLVYTDPEVRVGDAELRYFFRFDSGEVSYYASGFNVPAEHAAYVSEQKELAGVLTRYGYGLPTLILGLLALVYSILTRAYTSFTRGVVLSGAFFFITLASNLNMQPQWEQGTADSLTSAIVNVIYGLYALLMASLLYFSLVGGDGLWKQQGMNMWPRAKEPGYGRYVLDSVAAGYIWAFILLGVQTLMFIVLKLTLDNWSTTDASQSAYNMKYAWLLPLMAWLAGLSEEGLYRLFGIPLLRKLLRSTIAASFVTTLIWAFGHTLYPIYPVISRPIELIVIGLLFSYIFLRYGFITVLFSHVVFDSILMGVTLILMPGTANTAAGLLALVLPFLVGWLIYRFNPPERADNQPPYRGGLME